MGLLEHGQCSRCRLAKHGLGQWLHQSLRVGLAQLPAKGWSSSALVPA